MKERKTLQICTATKKKTLRNSLQSNKTPHNNLLATLTYYLIDLARRPYQEEKTNHKYFSNIKSYNNIIGLENDENMKL